MCQPSCIARRNQYSGHFSGQTYFNENAIKIIIFFLPIFLLLDKFPREDVNNNNAKHDG